MNGEQSANSGEGPLKKGRLYYCLAGWFLIIRHPIKRPIDLARSMELLIGDIERIRP